jgi:hypothetical protein
MLFSLYLVNKDKICNVTNMISFLIPSHNYGNFLKKCVKSIIKNNPKYIFCELMRNPEARRITRSF